MKPATKSQTNQTAAAMAGVAIALAVLKHNGVDVRSVVEGATGMEFEAVMAALTTVAAGAIVWFRERARPKDRQDVVTPRPK